MGLGVWVDNWMRWAEIWYGVCLGKPFRKGIYKLLQRQCIWSSYYYSIEFVRKEYCFHWASENGQP